MPKYQFLFQDGIPAGPGRRKQKGRARNKPIHKKVCKFFNTSKGCRKGNQCGFIHLQDSTMESMPPSPSPPPVTSTPKRLQDSPKPPSPSRPPGTSTPPPPHNPAHQDHYPSCPPMPCGPQMDNSYAVHMGYPHPMPHGFGYHWPALHWPAVQHWPVLQPMPYQPLPPNQADPNQPAQPQPTRPVPNKSAPTQPATTRPAPTRPTRDPSPASSPTQPATTRPAPTQPARDPSPAPPHIQSATYILHRGSLHRT